MSEHEIWKTLYERANAVRKERKLSPLMEVGSVGAAAVKLKEVMPDWWGQRYQEDE